MVEQREFARSGLALVLGVDLVDQASEQLGTRGRDLFERGESLLLIFNARRCGGLLAQTSELRVGLGDAGQEAREQGTGTGHLLDLAAAHAHGTNESLEAKVLLAPFGVEAVDRDRKGGATLGRQHDGRVVGLARVQTSDGEQWRAEERVQQARGAVEDLLALGVGDRREMVNVGERLFEHAQGGLGRIDAQDGIVRDDRRVGHQLVARELPAGAYDLEQRREAALVERLRERGRQLVRLVVLGIVLGWRGHHRQTEEKVGELTAREVGAVARAVTHALELETDASVGRDLGETRVSAHGLVAGDRGLDRVRLAGLEQLRLGEETSDKVAAGLGRVGQVVAGERRARGALAFE